jgi:hypothetical protein
MRTAAIILAASTALVACTTVEKDVDKVADMTAYKTVGEWQISVSRKAGPGCVAVRHFVNPTSEVQMGINATSTPPTGFFAIFVEGYEGIEPGQSIPATFAVGGQVYEGTFTGLQEKGYGGASVAVKDADVVYHVIDSDSMTITYGADRRVIVALEDADAAIAALRECQAGL